MSEKRTKDRSIADLMRSAPSKPEQLELLIRMGEKSDYSLALLSVTLLDHALREAIAQYLKANLTTDEAALVFDDTKDGPLATFAAKIRMASALGIFGLRTRRDLKTLANIRNAFAHSAADVSFITPEIAKECKKLALTTEQDLNPKQCFRISAWAYYTWLGSYQRNSSSILQEKIEKDLI